MVFMGFLMPRLQAHRGRSHFCFFCVFWGGGAVGVWSFVCFFLLVGWGFVCGLFCLFKQCISK